MIVGLLLVMPLAAGTVAAGAAGAAAVASVDDGADLSHTCLGGTAVILSFYFPSLFSPLRHHFLWRGSAHCGPVQMS